jgi:23S rRNA (pseudouridine1915-N3)-methyltransferase
VRVYLYYIGKQRDIHANRMVEEFLKRTQRYVRCEMRETKPNRTELWAKHATAWKIFLDPAGKALNSAQFTSLVGKAEFEARDLVFVVGGADGIPKDWTPHADLLLSLSPMTYPHELARVVLAEQIYRAFAALRGHPYPR